MKEEEEKEKEKEKEEESVRGGDWMTAKKCGGWRRRRKRREKGVEDKEETTNPIHGACSIVSPAWI